MTDDPPEEAPDPGKPFTSTDQPGERPTPPDPGKPDQKDAGPDPATETRDEPNKDR